MFRWLLLLALVASVVGQVRRHPFRRLRPPRPPPFPSRFSGFQQALGALPRDLLKYNPVNVTVFFESHCPDSRDFIEHQLYPTVFNRVIPRELFTLDFVPYGNAEFKYDPTTRVYTFSCQHGNEECLGNNYQTCYKYVIRNSTRELEFYDCMFVKIFSHGLSSSRAAFECTVPLKGDQSLYNAWLACNNTVGPPLLAHMGERTTSLSPRHSFIPWVTFDSSGSSTINDAALENFAEVVLKFWMKKNYKGRPSL